MPVDPPKLRKRKRKTKDEEEGPTKEENEVGKYLRWNCPNKASNMMGQKVEYFIGSKAVDCLLDSKWATGKGGAEVLFTTRSSAEMYLDRLLSLGFFNRVTRIKKKKKEDSKKEKDPTKEESDESKLKKKKKEKKEEEPNTEEIKTKQTEGTADGEGKKKRKVKVKLELHDEQIFIDGDEAYVWIFDPVHPKTFVLGVLVVIGAIVICLFPLWPHNVREYVWYISVALAAFLGVILFLAVFRYIIFAIVWGTSMGRHHFWLLPNLTEECGVLESFQPLYTHEYRPPSRAEEEKEQVDENNETQNGDEKDQKGDGAAEERDDSSEGKDANGEKEPWVKLTEEEVETARHEVSTDC